MSHHILLSLVGEQTIPLVQFIKALPPAAEYWFVETRRTQDLQCVKNIVKACGLEKRKVKTVAVAPEELSFQPPADWQLPAGSTLYLNLTAATKPMMLSVYPQYEAHPQARGYYISIGAPFAKPVQGDWSSIPLPALTLETYLGALGFAYTYANPNLALQQKAKDLLSEVIRYGAPEKVTAIIKAKEEGYKDSNKKWLSGEWWEDYLYATIKKDLMLGEDCIAQGVRLEHCLSEANTDSDNELDVIFIYQNQLYAVEGKVYSGLAGGDKITAPIYKLGTIIKTMGLQAKGIICLCANIRASKDQLIRIEYLKRISGVVSFLTLSDFKNKVSFTGK